MLVYWLAAWGVVRVLVLGRVVYGFGAGGIVRLLVMGRPVNNKEARYHLREQEGPKGV